MKLATLGRLAASVSLLLLGAYALAAPSAGGYHLIKKVTLGGGEGTQEYFDYITVDVSTRRVYLTHRTHVNVIDADSGAVVGDIPGLHQIHGVALVKELGKGFISEGGASQVTIFDLKTLNVTGHVPAGGNTDCIIYDPASKRIFAFNGDTKDLTVIDPAKGTVVATIPMGGRPEYAVADGKGMIYDAVEDTNEVVALDSRALTIKARWPVAPSGEPTSITMDQRHRRLYIGGRNPKLFVVMDADSGKIIGQSFPIGDRVDANTYDPETSLVASSTREGTIHIFHQDSPDKLSLVETIKTEFGAKTMALDPKTHNLYLTTSDFDPPAAPTAAQPNPQPRAIPGTFRLLIYGR
jgi:YVTN family beta-propeller protein